MCMLKYFSTKALSNDVLELGKKTRNFSEMYKVSEERDSNGIWNAQKMSLYCALPSYVIICCNDASEMNEQVDSHP